MVKPKNLKFGLNIRINLSVMCANYEDPKLRDRELRQKKWKKTVFVWVKNLSAPG